MYLQPRCGGASLNETAREGFGTVQQEYDRWNEFGKQLVGSIDKEIFSPKLSTSFFDQCASGALNRRLILSKWNRSPFLLPFSKLFFFTCFSVGSLPIFCPGPDAPADWRSAGR